MKKLALLLAVAFIATLGINDSFGASGCPDNDCNRCDYQCGDIQGDDDIDVLDAMALNMYLQGSDLDYCQVRAGDVDNDGDIDTDDVTRINNCNLNNVGYLNCGDSVYDCVTDDWVNYGVKECDE